MLSAVVLAALVAALTAAMTGTASAEITKPGPYGCKTDTIAAKKINGLTYTATEKTCVEIYLGANAVPLVRTHGVTRCYRSGSPFNCLIINGDSVVTHLYINGVRNGDTASGDRDCSNCRENSHYSDSSHCIDQVEGFEGREANLRVAWVSGHVSDLHSHRSFPVNLRC